MRLFAVYVPLLLSALGLRAQEPPLLQDYREGTTALAREHQYHASLSGKVVDSEGAPLAAATVLVFGHQPHYWALPLCRTSTDVDGNFRCEDISGAGRAVVWVVTPEGQPFAAKAAGITLVSGRHTELRPLAMPPNQGEVQPVRTFRGRVLAKDGEPVAGALLRLLHEDEQFDPSCYAFTDADGRFAISVRSGRPVQARLFLGTRFLEIQHADGVEELTGKATRLRLDLTGERTLQTAAIVWLRSSGPLPEQTGLAWSIGNLLLPGRDGKVPAIQDGDYPATASVWASAPGHLTRVVQFPRESVSFAEDEARELQVVDAAGKPVANAKVDLVEWGWQRRFQERVLGVHRTDEGGWLRLRAPVTATVVAYVYAEGYAPGRVCWTGEAPARVVLAQRSARLQLAIEDDVSTIYVRRAGTFDNEQMVYPRQGKLELVVAPGKYEITQYKNGPVAAAKAVTVAANEIAKLALDADQRPTIEVELPEFAGDGAWWVYASRSALGGMVAKRLVWTERGGPMPVRELVGEVEEKGERRFLLRLPTSGRYTVFVGHESFDHRLFREVVVNFGQQYRLSLPELDGELAGAIAAMPKHWLSELSLDGIAGPRLWLEPEGSTPFGALVTLPEPAEFLLAQLPRGVFTLHHHLYTTGLPGGVLGEQGSWGGSPVQLGDTAATPVKLTRGPDGELSLRVTLPDGLPASGLLRVRDRMHESWQQVIRGNSTLIFAADHLPVPPSARLVAGQATLERIRPGRVCFELLGDDGSTWFFSRDVVPGTVLEVRLGSGK